MAGQPLFSQVNLVVRDMDAALVFHRRLALSIVDGGEWPAGTGARHAEATMANGMRLEFDNLPKAGIWHAGADGGRLFRQAGAIRRVLGLALRDCGRSGRQ